MGPGEPDDNTWQNTYVINVQDKNVFLSQVLLAIMPL